MSGSIWPWLAIAAFGGLGSGIVSHYVLKRVYPDREDPHPRAPRDLGWRFVTWVVYLVSTPYVVIWATAARTEAK